MTPARPQIAARGGAAAAVFVDAGWLLAAAALESIGTNRREQLSCDYGGLLQSLAGYVDTHSAGMRRLRTYWYDAYAGAMPTYEHHRIAAYPYVTVRLVRRNDECHQQGVDVLIYRDLTKLAHERAITRAYLLTGGEGVRVAVSDAKDVGVQVVLLGAPAGKEQPESAVLIRECDEYLVLPHEVWKPYCRRRDPEDAVHDDHVKQHLFREEAERIR